MKQYLIVALIMVAVFLPVRLVFYNHVTTNWIGNLGVMSAIAIIIFILIEKNKLGWFGRYFKNRVRRLVFHKIIWVVILTSILTILMYGFLLWEIDKIESGYFKDDLEFVTAMLVYTNPTNSELLNDMLVANLYPSDETLLAYGEGLNDATNSTRTKLESLIIKDNGFYLVDMVFALGVYEMNLTTDGWGAHFLTVIVVEELETLWLLVFYRKVYFNKVGVSWHKELKLYPKNIKSMVRGFN